MSQYPNTGKQISHMIGNRLYSDRNKMSAALLLSSQSSLNFISCLIQAGILVYSI